MDVLDAVTVLNAASHRGARSWRYDATAARVRPEEWSGLGTEFIAPEFTPWEAATLARRLVEIGAVKCPPHTLLVAE